MGKPCNITDQMLERAKQDPVYFFELLGFEMTITMKTLIRIDPRLVNKKIIIETGSRIRRMKQQQ